MIHSLSGGLLHDEKYYDFAKVRLSSGEALFYLFDIPLEKGDKVLVPNGNIYCEGIVERIDKNVSEKCCPISPKRAKKILQKL